MTCLGKRVRKESPSPCEANPKGLDVARSEILTTALPERRWIDVVTDCRGTQMTNSTAGTSPLIYARIAGLLAILLVVLGPFSLIYVPSTLFVPGDATATADNIRGSESLFRLAIISDLLIFFDEIVLTVLLYVLLRPVSRMLSLVAAFARLSMAVIQGINLLPSFIVLLLLSGASYLTVFEPDQLDSLVLLFLNAR